MSANLHGMIKSPLNYIGGKYKLLPQIMPLFPKRIDTFIDLFCGGCNVGINMDSNKVIFNDIDRHLIELLTVFKKLRIKNIFMLIEDIIDKYSLSRSNEKGYDYYECQSGAGLGAYNREKYNQLRNDFNLREKHDSVYYIMLYVLIVYAFNNQIRFNQQGNFNLPVGKRDFNDRMRKKLLLFIQKLKEGEKIFTQFDFRDFDISCLDKNSFVYADPPYLITCATYNEQNNWNEDLELNLLSFLNKLNERGISFALSNVLESRGKTNVILKNWTKTHHYRTIPLQYSYANSNYQGKNKNSTTREILIVNY